MSDDLPQYDQYDEYGVPAGGSSAEGATGGPADHAPTLDAEAIERLRAWDAAPWTSHYEMLLRQGVDLPDPSGLSNREVSARLWEVVARLADRSVFVYHTDHLSDRELYEALLFEVLREPIKDLPPAPGTYFDIDLLGSGSEEDAEILLKYYLDGADREGLVEACGQVPEREDPPCYRDAYLPQPPEDVEVDVPDYLP